jgi:dynein light chain 1, axonemal
LKGINVLKVLKVLYISNNLIKEWAEFNRFQELPMLENLVFVGNPLIETMEEVVYKMEAIKRLPTLKKLDGETVVREEGEPIAMPQ